MKVKEVLTGVVAIGLTAAISIGATMAYLTDTDEDVNVMTLGNVYIDQIEQERVDDEENQTELTDFEQNRPMLPSVYEGDEIPMAPDTDWVVPGDPAWSVVEDNTNVIDKFVTVKNTGKSEAYVRTIFAFEEDSSLIHFVTNGDNITEGATWTWEWIDGTATIDGDSYKLAVATYTQPLAAGETTIPSLKQVYMDKTADNDYCDQFGNTYDILVFSQAIQTAGFTGTDDPAGDATVALDTGFGDITTTSHPWNSNPVVYESAALQTALANGGTVVVGENITVTDAADTAKNVITEDTTVNFANSTLKLDIPDADSSTANWIGIDVQGGNVVFEGTTGGVTTANNGELYAVYVRNGATLTINGGSYIGGTSAVHVKEGTLIINGGYFESQAWVGEPGYTSDPYLINVTDANYGTTANVIIQGGSFLNWNPATSGDGNFVADGYTVVEEAVAEGTLYTVVPA